MSGGPRVIGSGFGRTGTASLKRALEILGFGPCHHMEEVLRHPAEVPTWEAAARGEPVDWPRFLDGWGSAVDFPSAFYWRELAGAFPDAKVIHTVRDPSAWFDSYATTILPAVSQFPSRIVGPWLPFVSAPFRVASRALLERVFGPDLRDKANAMRVFEAHTEEVKRTIPADRLLVFDVREGWGPLCAFLGVPVPEEPFPRVNDAAEFQRRIRVANVASWMILFTPPLFGALAAASWAQRRGGPMLAGRQ